MRIITLAAAGLALGAALALAACGSPEEDVTYEVDATDVSGGELIVTEEDPNAIPVELPETPMVPVEDAPAEQQAPVE